MADYLDWPGKSGQTYRYWFQNDPTKDGLQAVGGNYAFVKQLTNGNFVPLYFGEAADLSERIPNHERLGEAARMGATHIMAHTKPAGQQARWNEERDLIERWNPALNVQHRTVG